MGASAVCRLARVSEKECGWGRTNGPVWSGLARHKGL